MNPTKNVEDIAMNVNLKDNKGVYFLNRTFENHPNRLYNIIQFIVLKLKKCIVKRYFDNHPQTKRATDG